LAKKITLNGKKTSGVVTDLEKKEHERTGEKRGEENAIPYPLRKKIPEIEISRTRSHERKWKETSQVKGLSGGQAEEGQVSPAKVEEGKSNLHITILKNRVLTTHWEYRGARKKKK